MRPRHTGSVPQLRDYTPARVELGRTGASLPTRALLEFQLAHAKARDAVHLPLAVTSLAVELKQRNISSIPLASSARDRDEYLKRPDLGRRLSETSRERLACLRGDYDAAFAIADGLSALAVHRHAVPLLDLLLRDLDWPIAPVAIVEQGRRTQLCLEHSRRGAQLPGRRAQTFVPDERVAAIEVVRSTTQGSGWINWGLDSPHQIRGPSPISAGRRSTVSNR